MIAFPLTDRASYDSANPFVDEVTGKAFVWNASANRWDNQRSADGSASNLTPVGGWSALSTVDVAALPLGTVVTAYSEPGQLSFYALADGAQTTVGPGIVSVTGATKHWKQIL